MALDELLRNARGRTESTSNVLLAARKGHGTQYFMAHPLTVGDALVLSNQTKAAVPAIGGGIFYAATVRNPTTPAAPKMATFTWEGGGFA